MCVARFQLHGKYFVVVQKLLKIDSLNFATFSLIYLPSDESSFIKNVLVVMPEMASFDNHIKIFRIDKLMTFQSL